MLGTELRLALLVVVSCTAALAEEPKRVVVQASSLASHGQSERPALRRLVAWRKGDLCIGRYDYSTAALEVTAVRSGAPRLRDPTSARLGLLDVQLLDDAARSASAKEWAVPAGTWTLTLAPDGTPVVSRVEDTPLARPDGGTVHDEVTALRTELQSGDPARQLAALRHFRDLRCFGLITDALALADSTAPVTDPEGMRARLSNGEERVGPSQTVLGVEVRKAVWTMSNALRDDGAPSPADSAARWRAWWKALLAASPR